ncbi:unnamed protein product [Protopolystoma xenopodis]|uniref:E3 ubiquitin-protein ligase ARIH1-like UBA-like domain-containing protein n=1 Tax=Protopolystoma xenopodis TaxID=117903 RepID=A0A448WP36_9PLAT|nr:unnamed protein product [Protopolystoma xenopodis]
MLDTEELLKLMNELINSVKQLIDLSPTELRLRLTQFKWDKDAFTEAYFDEACMGNFDISDLASPRADEERRTSVTEPLECNGAASSSTLNGKPIYGLPTYIDT